jgi:glycosyltransferase involved in cell wall biosynthesis
MRILVTTSVFPRWPGDATPPFVFNLCRDLVEAGCGITVLAPHSLDCPLEEDWNGMRIVRFPYFWPRRFQSLFYEGGMIVRLRENPLRILQLPFLCVAQLIAMKRLLAEGYDLVHAHSLLPQGWIAGIAKSRQIPLVISSHGADVFLLKNKWRVFLRQAVVTSTALIANSNATADRLRQLGATPGQLHLIPATPNYADPVHATHEPPVKPTLLFAGRVIPEKGVDALVEAMPAICRAFPGCTLRIAGSGSIEADLKERVQELKLESVIAFLGWLSPDQLRHEMQHATMLVAPSRMIEGQNLVVTEALSVGCPVATTPRGGVMDLVKSEETGFVIADTKAEIIAEKILHCLGAPEQLKKVGLKGFAHFCSRFSRGKVTLKTMELYRRLIENA